MLLLFRTYKYFRESEIGTLKIFISESFKVGLIKSLKRTIQPPFGSDSKLILKQTYTIGFTAITQPQVTSGWKRWTNFFILAPPSSVQSFDWINVSWLPSFWNLYNFFFDTGKMSHYHLPRSHNYISAETSLWLVLLQLHIFKLFMSSQVDALRRSWPSWPPSYKQSVMLVLWGGVFRWSRVDF